MARPRKNSGTPDARERILNSFWTLLGTHRLNEITVGMIVRQAGCNRGTFYYHFSDMSDLLYCAIEQEVMGESNLAMDLFNMATGAGEGYRVLSGRRRERFALIVHQGGKDEVERAVKAVMLELWKAVLCPDGEELKSEARMLIEYASSGIMGVIVYLDSEDEGELDVDAVNERLVDIARFMLSTVAEAQGLTMDELLMRLKILNNVSRVSQR